VSSSILLQPHAYGPADPDADPDAYHPESDGPDITIRAREHTRYEQCDAPEDRDALHQGPVLQRFTTACIVFAALIVLAASETLAWFVLRLLSHVGSVLVLHKSVMATVSVSF